MSRFTGLDPIGRYLPDGINFQLEEPLTYAVGSEDSEELITVPCGFVTDFASIPNFIQLILPNSIGRRAAIIHDYLYRSGGLAGKYTRKQSDEIFLEALEVLGVRFTRRITLYTGVRIGGWAAWKNRI